MNPKQHILFIFVFVLAGLIWSYWVRTFINSFLPPFQDPLESFDRFKREHLIYSLSIFLPACLFHS